MNASIVVTMMACAVAFEDVKIDNARSLVDRLWICDGPRVLSLTPSDKWTSGTAWLVDFRSLDHERSAWRGKYSIFVTRAGDALLLKIGFVRTYKGRREGEVLLWDLNARYEEEADYRGVEFELPLDGNRVPSGEITLIPTRYFFVDASGNEVTKYHQEEKLGGLIKYRGAKREVRSIQAFGSGEILSMQDGDSPPILFQRFSPPGFLSHGESDLSNPDEIAQWQEKVNSAASLVDREWVIDDGSSWEVLSLYPGASRRQGRICLVRHEQENGGFHYGPQWEAWMGNYSFSPAMSGGDVATMKIGLTRCYKGSTEGREIEWTISQSSRGLYTGAELEIVPHLTIDGERFISLVPIRTYYVNRSGQEGSHPGGRSGSPSRNIGYVTLGHTELARDGETLPSLLVDSPPPTLKWRENIVSEAERTASSGVSTTSTSTPVPDFEALYARGKQAYDAKEYDLAITTFSQAIRTSPKSATPYFYRAYAYDEKYRYMSARRDMEKYVVLVRNSEEAHNAIAWWMATSPDTRVRDGRQAIVHAKIACRLTKWENPMYIDTLAAAYAETGDFLSAKLWQTKAMEGIGEEEREDYHSRLKLYQQRKPYREP